MKPLFMSFPSLFAAAASVWYYCCSCYISHAGSFYAEAFLAPPSSIPAGHAGSKRAVARLATSSARRWHDKTAAAAAAAANTATCSATASHHQHSLSTTPLAAAHHRRPTHQRRRHSTARWCAQPEGAPEGSDASSSSSSSSGAPAPTNNSGGPAGTERAVNGVGGVPPSEAAIVSGETASPGAGGEPGRGGGAAGKGLEGRLISRVSRRVADSFPLLTADEIKNEIRALLNPEAKGEPKVRRTSEERLHPLLLLLYEYV